MTYKLATIRAELASLSANILNVDTMVVDDANLNFGAHLAIPCFEVASKHKKSPTEVATNLKDNLSHDFIDKLEVQGGYVNIWLRIKDLAEIEIPSAQDSSYGSYKSIEGQITVVEFTDPNPFKDFHIGHLYSNTVGESISRLLSASGADVHRVSYHGDVGLQIAKAIWGMKNILGDNRALEDIELPERTKFLGQAYAKGSQAYENDDSVKIEIESLNKKIYQNEDEEINKLYETGRKWSFDYFEMIYARLGVAFEKQYFESDSAKLGLEIVKNHIGDVFTESDGAVVFKGEDYGLHTRVFINNQGLPTYEAKDLALPFMKAKDFDYDKSIIITANEQNAYFKVMLKALEQFEPDLANKTTHIGHGEVKLPSGKMSSRTGDVISANDLLDEIEASIKQRAPESPSIKANALASVKYAFLKQNIGSDVVYDIEESISLEGQTGPYIQYAAVRIQSILDKVEQIDADSSDYDWNEESALVILIAKYPEVVSRASAELAPHIVAQYMYDLAREFNRYYEHTPVKDAPDNAKSARISLLKSARNVFESGLDLMNIATPTKM